MDSLSAFMKDVYIAKPDSRLTVRDIYDDFKVWIIKKYDITTWNKISQRQVYDALKKFPEYPYVRFKEGYCLKGITYRSEKIPIKEQQQNKMDSSVQPTPLYLTLNIIDSPVITNVQSPDLIKITTVCPRIPGVIFPTFGQRKL